MYFNTPDEGFFMSSAPSPAGPWEPLTAVWRTSGWDDPCPFWDDDGQGYLVTTHYSDATRSTCSSCPRTASRWSARPRSSTSRRAARPTSCTRSTVVYYHLFSEVKPEGRVLMMNRGSSLYGPFETRQLEHVNAPVDREPNQGGLVQAPDGAWYFVTHHGHGDWEGRPLSLLPVTWVDGWPILGSVGADGIGNMVWTGQVPAGGTPGCRSTRCPPW